MFDFKDIPERPPRSFSLLPGLKYSTILDKSMIFPIILIALIIGIFPIVMFLSIDKNFRLPFVHMEKADGNVTEIVDNSKCDRQSVSIHYQFLTNENRTYYGKYFSCKGNLYSSLRVGDSLPIVYDPKDPSFNGIEGELGKNDPPLFIFIFFPLIFLLVFAPMIMPNIKQIKDARSIFKKGLITKGEIIFIRRKKHTNMFNFKFLTSMEIFFRFGTANGDTLESKVTNDNDWLANKLEIGSSVTVAYMEKKPQKNIILDFYYR